MRTLVISILKFFFLATNLLFVYKYGLRQNIVPVELLVVGYSTFIIFLFWKTNFYIHTFFKISSKINLLFFISILGILILSITLCTDGNALQVDRWSAMDVAIKALINGDYPYAATDHMNGRTSNFPGLLLIGLPFYLMGNVGILQSFSFLLLSYTLFKKIGKEKTLFYIVLLLISPAYWWEIFAISDLVSNIIIIFAFITLFESKYGNQTLKKPFFLGCISAFLSLTRGIAMIPIILFVFKMFWESKLNSKIYFAFSFFVTATLLITMVLINCKDFETFIQYNPLVLQTTALPKIVAYIALTLPFIFSFKIDSFENKFYKLSSLLLLMPTTFALVYNINGFGFENMIVENQFDISYMTIAFPFMLYEIVNFTLAKEKN